MRYYRSDDRSDTCQHVLGNGNTMVAVRGMDLYQLRSGHQAGRNVLTGYVCARPLVESRSIRLRGRARWHYDIAVDGENAGFMEEYLTDQDVLVRDFQLDKPIQMVFTPDSMVQFDPETGLYFLPAGVPYVNDYPTDLPLYFRIWGENVQLQPSESEITVKILGASRLYIQLGQTREAALSQNLGREYSMPCTATVKTQLQDILEDYWYIYAGYISDLGGSVGAMEWNLAYVRDNYGASRGLLAMGCYPEAKRLLMHLLESFRKNGKIATAQSVGTDNNLHIHECDETENPGYLVLQAYDYLQATGDREFFEELMPMLQWAMEAQTRHLWQGMMPFCGDETYIPGGMLPRVNIDDGSCEATMLFIEAGRRMGDRITDPAILAALQEARSRFRQNFMPEGLLITNNPRRQQAPKRPSIKGVCMYCYCYMDGIRPNRFGLYTCPNCADRNEDIRDHTVRRLPCVQMMPAYIGSDLFTREELRSFYEEVAREVLSGSEKKQTGYEYGLLLYGLTVTGSPLRHRLYEIVLSARDAEGVWAEFYIAGAPSGMRWRFWEGGVNVMALLTYEACEKGEKL